MGLTIKVAQHTLLTLRLYPLPTEATTHPTRLLRMPPCRGGGYDAVVVHRLTSTGQSLEQYWSAPSSYTAPHRQEYCSTTPSRLDTATRATKKSRHPRRIPALYSEGEGERWYAYRLCRSKKRRAKSLQSIGRRTSLSAGRSLRQRG